MTRHQDPVTGAYSVIIDQADPVILISRELLREVFENGDLAVAARVRLADMIPYEDIYLGATLRIEGDNRTVVYWISERHDEYTYIGRWPD